MAQGKKSFLMYADQIDLVEMLPDELAGRLFKVIMQYVNDKNPEVDDLTLKLAFEPIKKQLKRDLKRYEDIVERNRKNGAKGGRPPEPKETQDNPVGFLETQDNPVGFLETQHNPEKPDNDTDTDNDTDIKEPPTPKGAIPTFDEFLEHAKEKADIAEVELNESEVRLKYESWKDAGWKTGGKNSRKIKNWKNTLTNSIKFMSKPKTTKSGIYAGMTTDEFIKQQWSEVMADAKSIGDDIHE